MLLNNFFYIDELSDTDSKVIANIRINPAHEIFKGHFPGQPVVPGVCVLEMMKEVLQNALQKKLMMTESSFTKFLTLFTPDAGTEAGFVIDYKLQDNAVISVSATLTHDTTVFFKFKGIFAEKN